MAKTARVSTWPQGRGPGLPGRGREAWGTLGEGEEGQTARKALLSTNELNLTASEPTSLQPETLPTLKPLRSPAEDEERGQTWATKGFGVPGRGEGDAGHWVGGRGRVQRRALVSTLGLDLAA